MNTLTKDRDALSRFQSAFVLTLILTFASSFFRDFFNSQWVIGLVWMVLIYGSVATGVFAWLFDLNKLRSWHFILAPIAGFLGVVAISALSLIFSPDWNPFNLVESSSLLGSSFLFVLLVAIGTTLVTAPVVGLVRLIAFIADL